MRSVFCGRKDELRVLKDAWVRAITRENRHPQVVVLVGDRGIGKTRIVQEFYAWLSTHHDGVGEAGYWPDELGQQADDLLLNVEPSACSADKPLPFLWWGLRLKAMRPSSAVEADLRSLHPHLESITRKIAHKQRWYDGARIIADFGIEAAQDAAGVSLLITAGKKAFELLNLAEERRRKITSLEEISRRRDLDIVDRAVHDLATISEAHVPICIVLDDVQFSDNDPSATDFFQKLISDASLARWPLLVILTCWHKEWHDESNPTPIASMLKRYRAEENAWWLVKEVGPIVGRAGDLGVMLRQALPGLTDEQSVALLARGGGNPFVLGQIIRHLLRHRHYFDDRNVNAALTAEGFTEALRRTTDLHDLIKERLADPNQTPPEVQRAVCLGSLQGMTFLAGLTAEVAERLGVGTLGTGIIEAERPHGFVALTEDNVVEFVQRVYQEVASDHLADIADPASAREALTSCVRARLENDSALAALQPVEHAYTWMREEQTERAYTCVLAASLFQATTDPNLLRLAYISLSHLVSGTLGLDDYASALAWARRFVKILDTEVSLPAMLYWAPTTTLFRSDAASDVAAANSLAVRILALVPEEPKTVDNARLATVVTETLAAAAQARGDPDEAETLCRKALSIARSVAATPEAYTEETYTTQTYQLQCDVRSLLDTLTRLLRDRGDIIEAEKVSREESKIGRHVNAVLSGVDGRRENLNRARRLTEMSNTPEAERDLSEALARLASALSWRDMRGDLGEAEKLYRESLEIRRNLPQELKAAEGELDLAASEFEMAEIVEACGKLAEAKKLFGDCLDVLRHRATTLKTPEAENNLHHFLGKVADEARARGDFDEAEKLYLEGLDISRRLAAHLKWPDDEQNVVFFYGRLGLTAEACGTKDIACAHWRHAHAWAKRLNDRSPTRDSAWMVKYTSNNVDRLCG